MKTVLVAGFEPFDGRTANASEAIVRALDGETIRRHRVVGVVLPCVFCQATTQLRRHIVRHDPAVVVCLGEAAGRDAITPERVAINVDDARMADNAGQRPVDRPIVRRGPAAYFSTLPIKAIALAIQARSVPAAVSQTAGTFVCNHVFYGLMHEIARNRPETRGGFIHVPCLPVEGDAVPALTLEQMVEAIRAAVGVAVSRRRDVRRAGGRES